MTTTPQFSNTTDRNETGFSCELDGGSIVCEATSATINHMYKNFTNKKGTEYSGNVILGFDNLEVTNELLKDCTNWDGVGEGFCSSFASRFKLMSCHFVQKFWIHFNKLGQVSGFQQPCAQCKYCNYEINTVIGKCVAHFKICSRVSITILQGYFGPNFQPNSNQHNNSCLPIEQNTVITTKHLQNSSINNFVDRISLVEQAKAELLFAQTIYQCKLFLSLPELEPIKALFKKLHPLDNIINSADYICLVSDGCNQLAIELTITLLSRNQAVNIDEDIKNIVQDNGFWEEVGDLFRILNQLVIGISIFESDTPCLSGVLDWYYDQLESSVEDHIKDILEKRWKSIYHPIMEVAHLLDPSFHGCCLTSNSMHKISQFIQKFYSNDAMIIWTQLLHYREKSGIFANQLAWKTVGKVVPITWCSGNFIDSAPELTQMAKCVLSIPTSSAASERNWPAFAYIYDKKQNQLTLDCVLKLSEELDKNLLDGDIEFIENENEESEYSNSSSSENEKRNQESDDLYDSD
ncbi:14535_t:CDS:2, partial [Entrophospora sp. SA101]